MFDYGIIGNCKACALVSKKASVDWFCFPHFDSPSVFAKLLDTKKGGSFEIKPEDKHNIKQEYIENTNIIRTVFSSEKWCFEVYDFFPRYKKLIPNKKKKTFRQNRFIRIIRPIRGKPRIRVKYNPKLNYAKGGDKTFRNKHAIVTRNRKNRIGLITNVDSENILNYKHFRLDTTKYFVIGSPETSHHFTVKYCLSLLNSTKRYWLRWVSSLNLPEKNRELIIRSALALKLLTFSETGAIIAASTTSIPEVIGTERNWDYRYCWLRDAGLTVDAFKKIGRHYEAKKLMEFISGVCAARKKDLHIMYGIKGQSKLTEKKLEHLEGYRKSTPARIGNAAYKQKQHDIFGYVIDILYLYYVYYEYEPKMTNKFWTLLKHVVRQIEKHWNEKDAGIWEFRGKREHFTYSKMMCCIGMDRAVSIAQKFSKDKLAEEWVILRDKIKSDILSKAWDEDERCFTMAYGLKELDASLLTMAYHNFLDPADPRFISTVNKIHKILGEDSLVRRYKTTDDFGRSRTAFAICSFWLVDALYYIGEKEKAEKFFSKLTSYSNHLGLFSEGFDIKSKGLRGNFPQAYTHIAIINSSILLSEWAVKRKKFVHSELKHNIG